VCIADGLRCGDAVERQTAKLFHYFWWLTVWLTVSGAGLQLSDQGLQAVGLFWENWPEAGFFGKSCRRGEISWTLTNWPNNFTGVRKEIDVGFFSTSVTEQV
jgi:hypothetical protein